MTTSDILLNSLLVVADCVALAIVTGKLKRDWASPTAVAVFAALVFTSLELFHFMRQLAWLLFVHLPLALVAASFTLQKVPRALAGVGALALVAVGIDAFVVEPHALEINRHQFTASKLNSPLRITVVSDLQTDSVGAYERQALKWALAEKPDLLLLPGDFVQARGALYDEQKQALKSLLKELQFDAPLGAWAVSGNAEHMDWKSIFTSTSVRPLDDRGEVLLRGDVSLHGLSLDRSFNQSLVLPRHNERFRIVTGHAPDFALGKVDADLLIAGHTHGGQVQLPFIGPLLTLSAVPRSWAAGVTHLESGARLVVSRGVGMERLDAPRLRFLCRPEIVTVDLIPPPTH